MKLSDKNSQQAAEYAAKRREQLERANKLRKEREAQSVAQQMASMDVNDGRGGARYRSPPSGQQSLAIAPSASSSRGGITTTSYTDPRTGASVAERIVVGREAMGYHDPWEQPRRDSSSRGMPAVAPNKRIVAPPTSSLRPLQSKDAIVSKREISDEFRTESPNNNHDLTVDSEIYFSSPLDPAGTLYDVSAMPVLCMSSTDGEVVVGCADHSLYAINVLSGQSDRSRGQSAPSFTTMHGKKHGHSDWITGVCHLADGRVLSCGMDNRLCLWNSSKSSCVELPNGHERSVSKIISDTQYNVALSCGYDGNVMAWAFGAGSEGSGPRRGVSRAPAGVHGPVATLYSHKSPVVECVFKGSTIASGTKEGSLFFWDLPTATLLNKHRAHRNGALTALESVTDSCLFVSGGSDGVLKLWDPRCSEGGKGSVARVDVHASSARSTTGVVTTIACLEDAGSGDLSYVATGGSEGNIVVTDCRYVAPDPRDKLIPVHRWEHHRAPVSSMVLAGKGGCIFSADAAGMVMCYDILGRDQDYVIGGSKAVEDGSGAGVGLRYGLGASSQGGVRALACVGGKLVAGGDDGNVLVFGY